MYVHSKGIDRLHIYFHLFWILCLEYCKNVLKSTSAFNKLESSRLEGNPNTNNCKEEMEEHFASFNIVVFIATMGGRYYYST